MNLTVLAIDVVLVLEIPLKIETSRDDRTILRPGTT
jgi:hypothetical protein